MNTTPKARIVTILIMLAVLVVTGAGRITPVFADQGQGGTDISAELVGQVTNPTPTASFQYGYLTYIKGIAPAALASSTEMSERTAFLSFYSDTVTKRVINNGPMRVIDRDGTLGIYLDAAPNGDFGSPKTFQDGEQVVGAEQHHQVVLNTLTGAFTANFDLTITWSKPFMLNGTRYQLGKAGDHFAITFYGQVNQSPPPTAHIAGFVRGLELRK